MTKRGDRKAAGGGCLGAPMRALSRACDSACDLYVRGMSGCAHRVPSGAAGAVGRGFAGRSAATSSMLHRGSSDRADDLVRAAARNRRVAPMPEAAAVDHDGEVGMKKCAATVARAAPAIKVVPTRKKQGPAAATMMGTIAEDAPCEFGSDGACVWPQPASRRRGTASGGLAARPGGFGAVKVGSEVWAR